MRPVQPHGPQTILSEALHANKYRGVGESFREAMTRVAQGLCLQREYFLPFREALLEMRFMPGGRVQSAVGSIKRVTPYNCFVSGKLEDSFVDGHGSIMERAREAAATMRMGGGIGYDFSTLRPRGADIKKLGSRSSGPIAFMDIFDAICKCTASSGHRRGAQMGVLRVDHPDIEEFIRAKQNKEKLTGFNISIGVTDEFMECVRDGRDFPLRFNGTVYREVSATALWDMIMRSTWDWAEPGVLFIDRINKANNLWYCEQIAATNPCGEQPLPPHGACLLGSFNLVKYLSRDLTSGAYPQATNGLGFDVGLFIQDIHVAVRAMDRVVDVATYPLYEQEQEAHRKRRMGLGVTGLANAGEALGCPYGSPAFIEFESLVLGYLRDEAYTASAKLAGELGPFPAFDEEYLEGEFIRTLPSEVQALIRENGIRNSHLLSIAPTGTISLCADNVSSGIEPVFAYEVDRTVQGFDGPEVYRVLDYGVSYLGTSGKLARDVTVDEHLAVLACAYKYVDSAVSKTCNVPSTCSWEEFKSLYMRAWEAGCKGCTTFREDGERTGILERVSEPMSCKVDPVTGRKDCE